MTSEPTLFTAVSFYSLAGTVAILSTALAASKALLPKHAGVKDKFTFVWLAFDALIHLIFEGSFLFYSFPRPRRADAFDAPLAKMWQEYGRADFRWAAGESTVVSLEFLTVLGCGPLCWYILYQLVKGDRARHYWLVVLSTAELYGGFMTFCPEWITGNSNLNTNNWLHFWIYLMFFNLIWVFIPFWLLFDSYGYIAKSLRDPTGFAAEMKRSEASIKAKSKKGVAKKAK